MKNESNSIKLKSIIYIIPLLLLISCSTKTNETKSENEATSYLDCVFYPEEIHDKNCEFDLLDEPQLEIAIIKSVQIPDSIITDTLFLSDGSGMCGNVDKCTRDRYYDLNEFSLESKKIIVDLFPDRTILDRNERAKLIDDYKVARSDTIDYNAYLFKNVNYLGIRGEKISPDSINVDISFVGPAVYLTKRLFYYMDSTWKWKTLEEGYVPRSEW